MADLHESRGNSSTNLTIERDNDVKHCDGCCNIQIAARNDCGIFTMAKIVNVSDVISVEAAQNAAAAEADAAKTLAPLTHDWSAADRWPSDRRPTSQLVSSYFLFTFREFFAPNSSSRGVGL